MLTFVVHHLVLLWLAFVALQVVVTPIRRLIRLGSMTFDDLGTMRHITPVPGSIPQTALTELHRLSLRQHGFSSLGIMTTNSRRSLYGFAELWVDDATRSILAQVMFVQSTATTKPVMVVTVTSLFGDRSDPRVVGMTSSHTAVVTSGQRPTTHVLPFPGLTGPQLIWYHRQQLAEEPVPPMRLNSLAEVVAILDESIVLAQQWRLDTGRMLLGADGHVRFGFRQKLWWIGRSGLLGKAVHTRRALANAKRETARWPVPPSDYRQPSFDPARQSPAEYLPTQYRSPQHPGTASWLTPVNASVPPPPLLPPAPPAPPSWQPR